MASQTGLGFHLLSTGPTLWIATDQWAYEHRPEDEGCVRTRDVRMLFTLFFSSWKHPHPDPDNFSCLRQSRGPAGPLTRMRSANHRRHPLDGAGVTGEAAGTANRCAGSAPAASLLGRGHFREGGRTWGAK